MLRYFSDCAILDGMFEAAHSEPGEVVRGTVTKGKNWRGSEDAVIC